jgi:hypothetical protein
VEVRPSYSTFVVAWSWAVASISCKVTFSTLLYIFPTEVRALLPFLCDIFHIDIANQSLGVVHSDPCKPLYMLMTRTVCYVTVSLCASQHLDRTQWLNPQDNCIKCVHVWMCVRVHDWNLTDNNTNHMQLCAGRYSRLDMPCHQASSFRCLQRTWCLRRLIDPKDEGSMAVQNVRFQLPIDRASQHKYLQASESPIWKPQISKKDPLDACRWQYDVPFKYQDVLTLLHSTTALKNRTPNLKSCTEKPKPFRTAAKPTCIRTLDCQQNVCVSVPRDPHVHYFSQT